MSDRGQRVTVLVDGEGQFGFMEHSRVREAQVTHLAALPRGMTSGRAAVAIVGRLRDGSYALLQTSLRVMLGALSLWRTHYGLEADCQRAAELNEGTRHRLQAALLVALVRDREGGEATFSVDDLNAVMQGPGQDFEMEFGADGKHVTLRSKASN